MNRVKLHEKVHIAVWTESIGKDRTEEREFNYVVLSTENGNRVFIQLNSQLHGVGSFSAVNYSTGMEKSSRGLAIV